jgi:hypothetical protein
MAEPVLRAVMAIVAARGLGLIGGQKLRRKAEATHAFFDRRGGAETDPGAPVAPRLVGKAIGTTLISGVLFAVLVAFADYAG